MKQAELMEVLGGFETPVLADAMRAQGLAGGLGIWLETLLPGRRVVGRAVTMRAIRAPEGTEADVSDLAGIVEEARRCGDAVLVIQSEVPEAVWGGCIGMCACQAGVRGVVVDGAIRDGAELVEMGLPVFFRGRAPDSIKWEGLTTDLMQPITVGGAAVRPGDFVVADDDGAVAIPPEHAEAVLAEARVIFDRERVTMELLRQGHSFAEAVRIREAQSQSPDSSPAGGSK